MKNCKFCAEEIQDDAIKCKHCGEMQDGTQTNKTSSSYFDKYESWIMQNYPMYKVVSKNEQENFLILNKEYKPFNFMIFLILFLFFAVPGLLYLVITLLSKKIISLTVYFDDKGEATSISKNDFKFLIEKYNKAQGFEPKKSAKRKSFRLS